MNLKSANRTCVLRHCATRAQGLQMSRPLVKVNTCCNMEAQGCLARLFANEVLSSEGICSPEMTLSCILRSQGTCTISGESNASMQGDRFHV
jgi:hypothetical protein